MSGADTHAAAVPRTDPVVTEIEQRWNGSGGKPPTHQKPKFALIVEGGGMRGAYSGAALAAMQQLGLCSVFDHVYAESAGAINASYFLAGQASYGMKAYTEYLPSARFFNPFRFGRVFDIDYAIDTVVRRNLPLNTRAVLSAPSTLYIALTNALNGQPRLVDTKNDQLPLFDVLKATAAIYPLFNRAVLLDGVPYVDGGIANPIPIQSAIRNGCSHILVLLTRPVDFTAPSFSSLALLALTRGKSSAFREAFRNMPRLYNRSRDIAFGKTGGRTDVHISVISPHSKRPKLTVATTAVKTLESAIQLAMTETRHIFRNIAK